MEQELKDLKLKKYSKYGIGKNMGSQVWVHKNYVTKIMTEKEFKEFSSYFPNDFDYEIIRWEEKKNEIAFIECKDFNESNEPIVGRVQRIQKIDTDYIIHKETKPHKDPAIYHHKWMFVEDDYKGFNTLESKKRSVQWKSILGVNKEVSSKIGKKSYWDQWLKLNGLPERNVTSNI